MMFLESPAIGAGLAAWQAWQRELASKASSSNDEGLKAELARAESIVKMFQHYPRGVDPKTPEFRKIVREYAG